MARYKEAARSASYAEVGRDIGLSTSAYANRKKADSIPYDTLLPAAHSRDISIEWLLFGEGEPFRSSQQKVRPIPEVDTRLLQSIVVQLFRAQAGREMSYEELTEIAQRAGIAGIIYNRVATLPDDAERIAAIAREVEDFSRVADIMQTRTLHEGGRKSEVSQVFHGNVGQAAGKDIVNKGPSRKR
jgi:hypothetical protein